MLENYLMSTVSDFKTALNVYVYEYLIKSKLTTTASSFISECNIPTELINLANSSTEVFLVDWFEIFYSVSKTLGRTKLNDPKIRNFLAELSRLVPTDESFSVNTQETVPFQNSSIPSLPNPNLNNSELLKRQGYSDSLQSCEMTINQTTQQNCNVFTNKLSPQMKKTKISKAASKGPKSLARASAPTCISLPPTNISLSSWAGIEPSKESQIYPDQSLPEVPTTQIQTSHPLTAANNTGLVSSYNSNKLNRELPLSLSSTGIPNKPIGTNPSTSQNQINPTQRFVAEQHAYIRNELKKSNQRAHSLNIQNSSLGLGSLLPGAIPPGSNRVTFPNTSQVPDFQALNLLNKEINLQNITNPSVPFGSFMNNIPQWTSSGLISQPNFIPEGMSAVPTLPLDPTISNPEMFDQFLNNQMLFGELDPNQMTVPTAEDPFSTYNSLMYFDQYPQ